MGALMKLDLFTPVRGEYMAVVHTGHVYDSKGNIVQEGKVLRKSGWGKNLITLAGFNALLGGSNNNDIGLWCVAGSGNTAPAEGNTVLASYLGRRSTAVMHESFISSTPDIDGFYVQRRVIRSTFNPGTLGSGAVNVAEAGMAMSFANPTSATPLFSRGLLVDEFGAPLTISLNAATEFLDIYWRHTRYIRAEATGTVSLNILGTPTNHDYIIRPVMLDPANANNPSTNPLPAWWGAMHLNAAGDSVMYPRTSDTSFSSPSYGPRVFDGDLTAGPIALPSGTALRQSSVTVNPYVTNSKTRSWSVVVAPADGNLAAHIRSFTIALNNAGFKIQVNPRIVKSATPARSLRLDFSMTYGNR